MILGNSTTDRAMCKSQKVRHPIGYTNVSVLGIVIILVVGSVIIVISWVLDTVVGSIQKHLWKRSDYKRVQWLLNSTLQLQRMAFESAGFGSPWLRCDETVPVTREKRDLGETFEVIDVSENNQTFTPRTTAWSKGLASFDTTRPNNPPRVTVVAIEDNPLRWPRSGP